MNEGDPSDMHRRVIADFAAWQEDLGVHGALGAALSELERHNTLLVEQVLDTRQRLARGQDPDLHQIRTAGNTVIEHVGNMCVRLIENVDEQTAVKSMSGVLSLLDREQCDRFGDALLDIGVQPITTISLEGAAYEIGKHLPTQATYPDTLPQAAAQAFVMLSSCNVSDLLSKTFDV